MKPKTQMKPKTLGELCDEVIAAANAYHELADEKRWNNLHRKIEEWNLRRDALALAQRFCWTCKHYDKQHSYCNLTETTISPLYARDNKMPNCYGKCKWEER